MPGDRARIVFDCNILVQALVNPESAAAQCFELTRGGSVEAFISKETLAELKEVLERPNILKLLPRATAQQIELFLEEVISSFTHIHRVATSFHLQRDPKDEPYLNLAITAKSDYIVSRDKDLLDLMTGHTDECKEFRRRFRRLKVIKPQELLRIESLKKGRS